MIREYLKGIDREICDAWRMCEGLSRGTSWIEMGLGREI